MQRYLYHIICLLSLVIVSSCGDFFESTLDLEIPKAERAMVIHAFPSYADNRLNISVMRPIPIDVDDSDILDFDSPYSLIDAEVRLVNTITGEILQGVSPEEEKFFNVFPVNFQIENIGDFFRAGDVYELQVDHPDFPSAIATQIMPGQVDIADPIVFIEQGGIDESGNEQSVIDVVIEDPVGTNYYEISVLRARISGKLDIKYASSNDPSTLRAGQWDALLIEDSLFDGELKSLRLRIEEESEMDISDRYYISLRTVTEDYYNWSLTLRAANNVEDNPFVAPVQIFGNMENGIGIFGLFSEKKFKM